MAELIILVVLLGVISTAICFIRIAFHVVRVDPAYGFKAFAWGFLSAGVGYLKQGYVEIDIVLWGIGGVVLYTLFQLVRK